MTQAGLIYSRGNSKDEPTDPAKYLNKQETQTRKNIQHSLAIWFFLSLWLIPYD